MFYLCRLQNDTIRINPNAGGRVLHALGELQYSKALVCVLHPASPCNCLALSLFSQVNECQPVVSIKFWSCGPTVGFFGRNHLVEAQVEIWTVRLLSPGRTVERSS